MVTSIFYLAVLATSLGLAKAVPAPEWTYTQTTALTTTTYPTWDGWGTSPSRRPTLPLPTSTTTTTSIPPRTTSTRTSFTSSTRFHPPPTSSPTTSPRTTGFTSNTFFHPIPTSKATTTSKTTSFTWNTLYHPVPTSSTSSSKVVYSTVTGLGQDGQLPKWSQCGGQGFGVVGTCVLGTTCVVLNYWYSQCL